MNRVNQSGIEEALVCQAVRGDLDAFNQLVLKYQGIAYHYAIGIVRDDFLADAITQGSFIKAFTNIHNFRGGSFRAW